MFEGVCLFVCRSLNHLNYELHLGHKDIFAIFSRLNLSTMHSGGSKGAPPGPNFLNFMQFFPKFGKIICWHPPPPRRVGATFYGQSWIRPCHGNLVKLNKYKVSFQIFFTCVLKFHCSLLKRTKPSKDRGHISQFQSSSVSFPFPVADPGFS